MSILGHMEKLRKMRRSRRGTCRAAACRSAAAVLELILALPVLTIALLAIVEFGLLLTNLQYVEFASRTGAQVAARMDQSTLNTPNPATTLRIYVDDELARSGYAITALQVRLEHNVPASGSGTTTAQVYRDPTSPSYTPDAPTPPATRYVRVTVFVSTTDVTPNLLQNFGLDFTGTIVQQTTTWPYLR